MPNWTSLSLAQLRVSTKADIITAVGNWLNAQTKGSIIALLMDAAEFADTPDITFRPDDEIATRTVIVRDALGAAIRTEWEGRTYYPSGEIDEITRVVKNPVGDTIDDQCIKHYMDAQPEGHYVLTVVLAPANMNGITAPKPANYWKLVDVGSQASLWAIDAPPGVLLALHAELWAMTPAAMFGMMAVASARSKSFLPAAVRYHTGVTVQQALARRDRIATYLESVGYTDTAALRAATDEHAQMVGIVTALGFTEAQLWGAMAE